MRFKISAEELKQFLHPHFLVNFILSVCFVFLKFTPGICEVLFENCELELKEYEMFTFLGCILVVKNRRSSSIGSYVGVVFMFCKVLSVVMFFRQSPGYGIAYGLLCLLHLAFLPEPVYSGPEKVVFFRSESFMDEIVNGDKRVTWMVELYAAWSPTCVNLAPIFSMISNEYGLDNLKFGKIDVSRYKEIADRYKIDTSGWSRNLPSLILIENGKESMRRPYTDPRAKVLKFNWTKDNIVRDFQLASIFAECKKNPLPKKQKTS